MIDKLVTGFVALVLAAVLGAWGMYVHLQADMTYVRTSYASALNAAQEAKAAAEQRATNAELRVASANSDAITDYKKEREDDQTRDARTINDLRADVRRLSVRTNRRPAGGCPVPGAAAATARSDDAAPETLAGPVAARLAERYADYNALVDQLTLCQAVVKNDRLAGATP
jgi:Bacteriophage Rz lysis protein